MALTTGTLRLTTGVEEIEEWSETASDPDRNAVHELLFAVAGDALLRRYPVLGGPDEDSSLSVLVRPDLAVCLVFPEPGTFGVLAIGDPTTPPLDLDEPSAAIPPSAERDPAAG